VGNTNNARAPTGSEKILFSPVYNQLEGELLAKWILDHGIEARLQLQLHKILWGEKQGV